MALLDFDGCKGLFAAWNQTMQKERDVLVKMDQQVGDGDLGLTMSAAFGAAAETVYGLGNDTPLNKLFMMAGMTMAKAAPSTMGSLMATGFMRGGKALPPETKALGTAELAIFFKCFVEGIMERGGAKPGDKTIVDALMPAAKSLQHSAANNEPYPSALKKASQAANDGIEATRNMKPQHGKAAVFQEKSIGLSDAGATFAGLLFRVLADFAHAE